MYSIRTTPGLVIESRPYGEAGKLLSIFTRDLGLVHAMAQGIRLEKSKLRYHAQDHSIGVFSFVKGNEMWRLTDAKDTEAGVTAGSNSLMIRLSALLKRFLHGEEPHPGLFDVIYSCARFLAQSSVRSGELSAEHMETLESLVVLKALHALGYIGNDPEILAALDPSELDEALLERLTPLRRVINKHINRALKESHL